LVAATNIDTNTVSPNNPKRLSDRSIAMEHAYDKLEKLVTYVTI